MNQSELQCQWQLKLFVNFKCISIASITFSNYVLVVNISKIIYNVPNHWNYSLLSAHRDLLHSWECDKFWLNFIVLFKAMILKDLACDRKNVGSFSGQKGWIWVGKWKNRACVVTVPLSPLGSPGVEHFAWLYLAAQV